MKVTVTVAGLAVFVVLAIRKVTRWSDSVEVTT